MEVRPFQGRLAIVVALNAVIAEINAGNRIFGLDGTPALA